MNKKGVVFQILIALFLLTIIETISFLQLNKRGRHFPFLINFHHSKEIEDSKEIGFDEINPFWGWNMSDDVLQKNGYNSKNAVISLSTNNPSDSTLRIFITGGSTSDIVLDKNNWPILLHRLLSKKNIPHTIYVAAVGGFNSAQEYLRLIEQGLELKPHFYISYSGANEARDFGFITEYENDFYIQSLDRSETSFFLPNTIYFIKTFLLDKKPSLSLAPLPKLKTAERFQKNTKLMYAASKQFGFKYIGILQPLNGIANYRPPEPQSFDTTYLMDYRKYYPSMQKFSKENPEILYDLTSIFDSSSGYIYIDDCHLNQIGNQIVAEEMFKLIKPSVK